MVSGEVGGILGRQRMERRLAELNGPRRSSAATAAWAGSCASEFSSLGMPFVIVDQQAEPARRASAMPHGIAARTATPPTTTCCARRASSARAVLVTVAASDADNLYITMSARLLNEKLFIVARAEDEEAEQKLLRAGANRVVSPYVIGGQRMAQAVLRPTVMDFIELATRSDYLELQIEEIEIEPGSALAGRSLKDSRVRQDLGIIIVAIKQPDGTDDLQPASPRSLMEAGDLLITLGHRDQLDRLETLAGA